MRSFPPEVDAMIMSGQLKMCFGIKIDFDQPLTITDAGHDVFANNDHYRSHSRLVGMEAFTRNAKLEVAETTLSLNTTDQYSPAVLLGQKYRNRKVWIRRFYLDNDNQVSHIETVWEGRITKFAMSKNDQLANLTIKNSFANFEAVNSWRTTPQSHKRRHPNDECMKYAAKASETIYWGGKPAGGDD